MTTRHEQLERAFKEFDSKHPQVWELFQRFTFNRIKLGFKHYSAYAICERIRWETDQAKVDPETEFKINNNFRPFYARKFMDHYPWHQGFFRTRHQTSQDTDACSLPELTPKDFPND